VRRGVSRAALVGAAVLASTGGIAGADAAPPPSDGGVATSSGGAPVSRPAPSHPTVAPDPARTGIGFSPLSFVYTALPVSIGAAAYANMEDTNETLRSLELDELPTVLSTVSLALVAAYPVGLVVEPMYRFSIAGTDEATMTMHQVFLNFGWLIHAHGDQVVYPYLGVGYGNTSFEVTYEVTKQSFDETLRSPDGEALLSNSSLMLQVGLSSALWGSGNGDFIGLRVGAFVAPLSSGWKRRGFEVTEGPAPPTTGFYLMGSFGVHDPRWR
jgi:hypothetical protein